VILRALVVVTQNLRAGADQRRGVLDLREVPLEDRSYRLRVEAARQLEAPQRLPFPAKWLTGSASA
jgi:hypothetical protein